MLSQKIQIEHCCECGIAFGMEHGFREQRISDGVIFYCLNGHPQSYTNNLSNQLTELKRKNKVLNSHNNNLHDALEHEKRRINGYKGQLAMRKNSGTNT